MRAQRRPSPQHPARPTRPRGSLRPLCSSDDPRSLTAVHSVHHNHYLHDRSMTSCEINIHHPSRLVCAHALREGTGAGGDAGGECAPAPARLLAYEPAESHLDGNAPELRARSAAKLSLSGGAVSPEVTDGRLPSCQTVLPHCAPAQPVLLWQRRWCDANKFWNLPVCRRYSTETVV